MSQPEPTSATPLADVCEEGLRLVRAGSERGLPLRLVGGVAIWARCPSARLPGLARSYADIDLVSLGKARPAVTDFLEEMGYRPDRHFNALHGAQRLYFVDPVNDRPLDVLLDGFAMCHAIDLHDRLARDPDTIPLADLLLTKLQVVALNDKDIRDLIALLADHPLEGEAPAAIDVVRVAGLLAADWGFEHTVRRNLARVRDALPGYDIAEPVRATVRARIDELVGHLDRAPKTLRWKVRSLVGERVKWYEEPEEVSH